MTTSDRKSYHRKNSNHNSHQCGDGPRVFQCFNKTFSLTIGIDHPLTKSKAQTKNVKLKKTFRHISKDTVAITPSFEYFNKTLIVNCFNQYQSNTSVIVVDQFCTWPSWGWSRQSSPPTLESGGAVLNDGHHTNLRLLTHSTFQTGPFPHPTSDSQGASLHLACI